MTITVELFMLNSAFGVTYDDAYILYNYAKNLRFRQELAFNPGEESFACTSIFYCLLLAILTPYPIIDYLLVSVILNILLQVIVIALVVEMVYKIGRKKVFAFFAGIIFPLLYYLPALNGMETTLHLFIVLLLLRFLISSKTLQNSNTKHFVFMGILASMAYLTRPDSLIIILLMFPLLVLRYYNIRQPISENISSLFQILINFALGLVILLPYLLYSLIKNGSLLPNTLKGKVIYFRYYDGIMNSFEEAILYSLTRLGFFKLAIVLFSIFLLIFDLFKIHKNDNWINREDKFNVSIRLALILLYFAYPFFYGLFLPALDGRYIEISTYGSIILGLSSISLFISYVNDYLSYGWRNFKFHNRNLMEQILVLTTILVLTSSIYLSFNRLNNSHVHIGLVSFQSDVRFAAAEWLRENTNSDSIIATDGIGVFGYYSERYILDLAGLIQPEVWPYLEEDNRSRAFLEYMQAKNASYMVCFAGGRLYQDLRNYFNQYLLFEVEFSMKPTKTSTTLFQIYKGNPTVQIYSCAFESEFFL